MTLSIIVLNHQENFVKFLNPDFVEITETCEKDKVRRIKFSYQMQSLDDARSLFRIGYKLWVTGDDNLSDCLYVINTSVTRDYFKENNVSLEAEEVLVELNYASLFSQSDVTEDNGFKINIINDIENVTVDYNALNYWFGDYFNIGVVQECLSNYVSRIVPTGLMTKMELLRFIEDETSNIFVTRYEKDVNSNVIHRYLDFLNPNNNNKDWELNIHHVFNTDLSSSNIALYDDQGNLIDEGDTVTVYDDPNLPVPELDIGSCFFKLTDNKGNVLFNHHAFDFGLTSDLKEFKVKLKYSNNQLTVTAKDINYNVDTWITGQDAQVSISEELLDTNTLNIGNIANNSVLTIYDSNKIWYKYTITPQMGDVHDEILDLGFNVENIECEIDENNTYTAIAPVLHTNNDKLTKQQLDIIIENWKNLEVKKGDRIPMIVEKVTLEAQPTDTYMEQVNITNNYYSRPVNPNDSEDKYEYYKASAYWLAPFNKNRGELFVTDETITGIDYLNVYTRPDLTNTRAEMQANLKTGTVSTSDEDIYAIFNDVCMKLKEVRYPEINIEVDVANLIDHKYNGYNIHDLVFIKVPGFGKLVTAQVIKTEKQAHDINKNKITLSNYSVNTKVAQQNTYITGSNIAYTYPETAPMDIRLFDENDLPLSGKLVTFQVYNQSTFTGGYSRVTKNDGTASLLMRLPPGTYTVNIVFGGDISYNACEQEFQVNVGGTIDEAAASDESTTSETTYYTKYGVSPDGSKIMAIGRPSASGESSYGYTFYRSVFERKCPHCGSTELYWGIFWAGNETSNWGTFPATGRREGGSAEGHIFCKNCDADYSCILGREHVNNGKKLTRISGPEKVAKTEAYTLKNGQMIYEKKTTTVATEANTADRPAPIANISQTVKQKALSVVGASTGLDAAKKIAAWMGTSIKYASYSNFIRSPETVLSMGSGNCCDQTRLMLQMMDGAGVTSQFKLIYIHTVGGKGGHVFAKINGTYVDPCKAKPWGNYVTGYGVPGSAPSSVYPKLPF